MPARNGVTLIETMATMAVIVILGGVAVPSLQSFLRDTPVKEAGDILRAKVSAARSHAIGEGRAYRLSVAEDGTRVRVTADDETETPADDAQPLYEEEPFPATVRATPVVDPEGQTAGDEGGWVRVATFLPDGTCREDSAEVDLAEPGCYTLRLTVRGLTGGATLTKLPAK
jgi:prepilin-type N-terminal cleavage/methylation domain-containing protein